MSLETEPPQAPDAASRLTAGAQQAAAMQAEMERRVTLGCFTAAAKRAGMLEGAIDTAFAAAGIEPSVTPDREDFADRIEQMRSTHKQFFPEPAPRDPAEIADNDDRLRDAGWQARNQAKLLLSARAKLKRLGLQS